MSYFSYHTHSSFCDGKEPPEAYVLKGIELGMEAVGFSSHASLNCYVPWAMKAEDLIGYIWEVERLKTIYQNQIDIHLSLEIDYIPGFTKTVSEWKQIAGLDYTIGSVHLVKAKSDKDFWFLDGPDTNYSEGLKKLFEGDIKKAVSAYYNQVIEMIETQKPDVIGHIDKVKMNNKGRYFSENERWYIDLLDRTLEAVQNSKGIVEVNTRGLYKKKSGQLFPDGYFLNECCRRDISVTISSDAHKPEELISEFEETKAKLKDIGFKSISVFKDGNWIERKL